MNKAENISVILLAGGKGTRMRTSFPKQFMKLLGKEIAMYSYEIFAAHPQVQEIAVVCEPEFRSLFKQMGKPLHFAMPGKRRQDSTYSGLKVLKCKEALVCVHDSARPCLNSELLERLFAEGKKHKAAALGVQSTSTLKEVNTKGFLVKALERSKIWDIQTPQIVERSILEAGFEKIIKEDLQVTDETSIVELLAHPVKIVLSSTRNIKLTEPSDMKIIEALLTEDKEAL